MRATRVILLALVPAGLVAFFVLGMALQPAKPGWHHVADFHTFWQGARDFRGGMSPYPDPAALGGWAAATQQSFVYPAPVAAALVPLSFIPYPVASALFVALSVAGVALALWLFGVRDWRCYGACAASPAFLRGMVLGSLSLLLLLGVALAWRYRDSWKGCGAAVAGVVVAKLFVWPLLLWLVCTRRWRAALLAIAADAAACLVAWAWLGFDGLSSYAALLRRLSTIEGPHGFGPAWLAHAPAGATLTALLVVSAGAAVLYGHAARRLSDETAFAVALAMALVLSPMVWLHYFVLLYGVVAVTHRRFGPIWLLPLALWPVAPFDVAVADWKTVVALGVTLAVVSPTLGMGRQLEAARRMRPAQAR